ncbi:MAG TPA: Nif3-like dinuclear metal center hexameric protein [Verrucomicrobiota bacterium]|nr:Nif3-like dinuclear metal center hexameric protein [Verrucomicrobiota bacterium]HNU50308.1 Nif3-like dinuclear metal center hexameric protein [Verrucomicrobiota bacterium]
MPAVSLSKLVRECDRLLRPEGFQDDPRACNGLQVGNRGRVTRLAAAVDATPATVRLAAASRAGLLLVHHGLFWSPRQPWTGHHYDLLRSLLDHDLAVYSAHLPLDAHPRLGNNARLCAALGLRRLRPFLRQGNRTIGFAASARLPREQLASRLEQAVGGPVRLIPGGPAVCRRIGVVTGGAGGELAQAAAEGADTLVTGEGPHWTFGLAEELGVNVLYAGHYATETFGVRALADHLSRRFGLPWEFLDHPTGL